MRTEESLYIKILEWAYNKGEDGFKWDDLKSEFTLTQPQEHWVIETFRNKKEIIGLLPYKIIGNNYVYGLTAEGISEAINYLALQEARKSSRNAMYFAGASLLIAFLGILLQMRQVAISDLQISLEQINQVGN